ncbi:hypothetical protein EC991_001425 [Linnemannia zychae]|nr:hypothetical protein EC991_001425 [Linnemannia zychae]
MLAFRDRMDEHRQAAWKQVTPWIKDIWFDNANGACHLKLGSTAEPSPFTGPGSGSGSESSTVRWLQDSQNHVSTRLLSFLVRWVSCKAHNPRLEDIQSLQQNLRLQQRQFVKPELVSPTALPSLTSSSSTSTSPTVYRKLKQRASKPTSMTLDPIQTMQQQQELRDMSIVAKVRTPFVRMPVTIAGVMFSPPRKTKGVPDHWTISRQPMSQADQISTTVSVPLEDDLDVLWNQRFFLRMIRSKDLSLLSELTRKSEERVQIRPLSAKDVDAVRRRLKPRGQSQNQLGLKQEQRDSDGLKRLDQWLSTVPGNARYTIPVILSPTPTSRIDNCDNDKGRTGSTATCNNILSLPTLGLHFGPTLFTFQSRFKSNPPAGAKDMCYFSQQPTYPLSDKPQDPCSVESLV